MAVTMNMNAAALALVGSNTKFRLEARNGALFLRPTDRKASPDLVAISRKNTGGSFSLGTKRLAALGLSFEPGTKFAMFPGKYGWIELVAITPEFVMVGEKGMVRVSRKS